MSILSKTLIAATARKNAPPRFGDVEEYKFGKYDVDLGEILISSHEQTSGVFRRPLAHNVEFMPISVNYDSDGLKYYISYNITSLATESTSVNDRANFDVAHLTLSEPHDLNTITNISYHPIVFPTTNDVDNRISNNLASALHWSNGGFKCHIVGQFESSQISLYYEACAFEVTTRYTDDGITLLDSSNHPIYQKRSYFLWDIEGEEGAVFSPGMSGQRLSNPGSSDKYKVDPTVAPQFPAPNFARYWKKLKYRSNTYLDYSMPRIWIGMQAGDSSAHIFYPRKATTTYSSVNHFFCKHTVDTRNSGSRPIICDNNAVVDEAIDITDMPNVPTMIMLKDYWFNPDGTRMFTISAVSGSTSNASANQQVYQHNLSTAYDLTSATSHSSMGDLSLAAFGIQSHVTDICSMCFNTRVIYVDAATTQKQVGERLYLLSIDGNQDGRIHIFDLSTAFDVTTASFVQTLDTNVTGLTSANGLNQTEFVHQMRSLMFFHKNFDNTSGNQSEGLIVYPDRESGGMKSKAWFIGNNDGTTWINDYLGDLDDKLVSAAKGNTNQAHPEAESVNDSYFRTGVGSLQSAHDYGETIWTGLTSLGVRHNTYYKFLDVVEANYQNNTNRFETDFVDTDHCIWYNKVKARRGSSTGTITGSSGTSYFDDGWYLGDTCMFTGRSYGSLADKRAEVWTLCREYADNFNELNPMEERNQRYRICGIQNWNIEGGVSNWSSTPSTNGEPMIGGPIGEIFSPIYEDPHLDQFSNMFVVPRRDATADYDLIPARLGFIDKRGYIYYLESDSNISADSQNWPKPDKANEPRGNYAAQGLSMRYTKNPQTTSVHDIFVDDITTYNANEHYQMIDDFAFDETGHVCVVLTTSNSDKDKYNSLYNNYRTSSIFVYYVDIPFSTNKSDWTYVLSDHRTNPGAYPICCNIINETLVLFDDGADAIRVNLDIGLLKKVGPAFVQPGSITYTGQSNSFGLDAIAINNAPNSDGSHTYVRLDNYTGNTITTRHSTLTDANGFITFDGTLRTVYYDSGFGVDTQLITTEHSPTAFAYDFSTDTIYVVEQLTTAFADNNNRQPLKLFKAKIIDKEYGFESAQWKAEELSAIELRTKVPVQPYKIKIHRDRLLFLEVERRFIGSVKLR